MHSVASEAIWRFGCTVQRLTPTPTSDCLRHDKYRQQRINQVLSTPAINFNTQNDIFHRHSRCINPHYPILHSQSLHVRLNSYTTTKLPGLPGSRTATRPPARTMGVIRKKTAARGAEGGVKYHCDVCSVDITSTVSVKLFCCLLPIFIHRRSTAHHPGRVSCCTYPRFMPHQKLRGENVIGPPNILSQ